MIDTPSSTQNRTVNSVSISLIAVYHSEYCYCILFLEIKPPVWERHKIGTIFWNNTCGIAAAAGSVPATVTAAVSCRKSGNPDGMALSPVLTFDDSRLLAF